MESTDRRRSGLWAQNHDTGFYTQKTAVPAAVSGPYQYYQPSPLPISKRHQPLNGSTPPNTTTTTTSSMATTATTAGGAGVLRSDSRKVRDLAAGATEKLQRGQQQRQQEVPSPEDDVWQERKAMRGGGGGGRGLRIDPHHGIPPSKVREGEWSPREEAAGTTPTSTTTTPTAAVPMVGNAERRRQASSSVPIRRSSVPDRSPLQKLEMEFSSQKESKRARAEEAEHRAQLRQRSLGGRYARERAEGELLRQGTLRAGGRVVSDPVGPPSRPPAPARGNEEEVQRANEGLGAEDSHARPPMDVRRQQPHRRSTTGPTASSPREAYNSGSMSSSPQDVRSPTVDGKAKEGSRAPDNSYRHRARDAGFAGAAAAMAGVGAGSYDMATAAERGKAAHERRKAQMGGGTFPVGTEGVGRSGSRKLQKRGGSEERVRGMEQREHDPRKGRDGAAGVVERGGGAGAVAGGTHEADVVPRSQVATGPHNAVNYRIPPQTASGVAARELVGFGTETMVAPPPRQQPQYAKQHHHFSGGVFHPHDDDDPRVVEGPGAGVRPLDEWRSGGMARLTAEDLELEQPVAAAAAAEDSDHAWWEKKPADNRRRSGTSSGGGGGARSGQTATMPQLDGPYEEDAKHFRPPLFLQCGPLLRYTGLRREGQREIWRGSILIVTDDRQSDYISGPPVLRIFAQPMDLLPPPSAQQWRSSDVGADVPAAAPPPEAEDAVAGQVKLSRTGRPLYVRPVHAIEGGVDLSREENPLGLYSAVRTPVPGPPSGAVGTGMAMDDGQPHVSFHDKSRVRARSGETTGRYREVRGFRLHAERGVTFWRFNVEIELSRRQTRVAYRINRGPAVGFWVPGRGATMNVMFHSCNGFSLSVNPDALCGPDPLWRDVMNRHQRRPFQVMLGGGDQIYNDAVMVQTELFREWSALKSAEHKHHAPFTPALRDELEAFYLSRYAMWFSQGLFAMAAAQIPMVNIWDDHDIIDGYGSYPHAFMRAPIFTGLGAVAFKYYMLFQHQSVVAEGEEVEPSWLLGASPGPYIAERSRSIFVRLGAKVGFLGLDCRTERMRDEVLSQETWDRVFDRLRLEIRQSGGEIKHLLVLLGVPIAYPRLNFLENILTSRAMDPIKALGRTGVLGGFVNKFDGGVEILDDLDDHWTAKHHKAERNWFVQELQALAAETSVRITILGGDVHLGAVGQFYSPSRVGLGGKDRDWRYMPNVISSAIVNSPPPTAMADLLNRRNKVHHLDAETDEDLIPLFERDVDGRKRNNRRLLPRRNFCTIAEYVPGSTPQVSRSPSPAVEDRLGREGGEEDGDREDGKRDGWSRRFPPSSMRRTMSLTRGPAAGLVRRLSGSSGGGNRLAKHAPPSPGYDGVQRSQSLSGPHHPDLSSPPGDRYSDPAATAGAADPSSAQPPQRPNLSFHRRPTTLSIKAARKAAAKGGGAAEDDGREPGAINLQHGLDISLMMEVDPRDPGGRTVPYRLLVPALWCHPGASEEVMRFQGRRVSLMDRIRGRLGVGEMEWDGFNEREQELEERGGEVPMLRQRGKGVDDDAGRRAPPPHGRRGSEPPPPHPASAKRTMDDENEHDAYSKGYNLSSPPIGSGGGGWHHTSNDDENNNNTNNNHHHHPYPNYNQHNYHHRQTTAAGREEEDGELSNASLTPEEESGEETRMRTGALQRAGSKAERFLGIGEEGGAGEWGGNGGEVGRKRGSGGWKIWKTGRGGGE